MHKRRSFHRFLTPILAFAIALFAAVTAYVCITTYNREQTHIEEYTHSQMKSLILDLEIKMASIESVLISESQMHSYPADTGSIFSMLHKIVKDNDFLSNVAFDWWDEEEDRSPDACSNLFYAARDSSDGHIMHGFVVVYDKDVYQFELDNYVKAAALGAPLWSMPYYDGRYTNRYVVTCYEKGKLPGVMLTVDVEMRNLLQSIDNLQFYDNSEMYIIDPDGNIFSLASDSRLGLSVTPVTDVNLDEDKYFLMRAHYDKLNVDIVDVVPKTEIFTFMWSRIFAIFIVFILLLTVLSYLVHRSFEKAQRDLAYSIKRANKEEVLLKRIEGELAIAGQIQNKMLSAPGRGVHFMSENGCAVDIMSKIIPAREVGGDLYEYRQEGHNLVVCIADVSGKGIPASVVMTKCCTLFHAYVSDAENPDPAGMLEYMNVQLCRRNESVMFVTMWAGVIDMRDGTLRYSSAGHNRPVGMNAGGSFFLDSRQGVPLGLFEDASYTSSECKLYPGDSILLYTDGITEAENPEHALFGDEKLLAACGESSSRGPEVICDYVLRKVRSHARGCKQSDDITLLCLTYGGHFAQLQGIEDVTALHTLAEDCGFSYRAALALEEIAVNSFKHGGAAFVSAEFSDGIFTVIDDGAPFDPVTYVKPQEENDDELSIGGRGIALVKSICREFTYARLEEGYNKMTLRIDS